MIKKGGEQKNNTHDKEILLFMPNMQYAIYNFMERSESTYYRFIKSKIEGYRVHS